MTYYVDIYDFEIRPDSSMTSEEIGEYAEAANMETVRHYSFTDPQKAKRIFDTAKEAAFAIKTDDNTYEVRCIKLIEAEPADDAEYQLTIDCYCPGIKI